MKHSRNKLLTLITLTLAVCLNTTPAIASKVENLDIYVRLYDNGTADIQEEWDIELDDQDAKTEWYVAHRNLGEMQMKGLHMRGFIPGKGEDQTFKVLENWDVEASREEKSGKCGINAGTEICWGFGDYGRHRYIVNYKLTNLVQGYDKFDGFNHCFVDMSCTVNKARIILFADNDTLVLSENNTRRWAFGYKGKIEITDSCIVATNDEPLTSGMRMSIMLEFDKGVFDPEIKTDNSWEAKKQAALDGSDYNEESEEDEDIGFWEIVGGILLFIVGAILYYGAIFLVIPLYYMILGIWWVVSLAPLRKWCLRKKLGVRDGYYYRDIKPEWSLAENRLLHSKMKYVFRVSKKRVITAVLLRLIAKGKVYITKETVNGEELELLKIVHPLKKVKDGLTGDRLLEDSILKALTMAAGEDQVLQPKELKKWAKQKDNRKEMHAIIKSLDITLEDDYIKENAADLMGLRAFLKDFTLLNERSMMETKLWDEYMVYAQFFGIADEVMAEMKKICPEYVEMSTLATSINLDGSDSINLWCGTVYSATHSGFISHNMASGAGRSGGGYSSSSSFGGGGGYSGGGGGGGR